ncbi:MAG TPA: histidine kinase dimerization/phospho-acceptor domain-containing protein, partial [Candidatus Omnitrophota bacterium]|nr:histidine kinase dimerization/phospho-acceptor domain-containing protein [Candidatus Omnitrophota bacterium]
MPGILRKKKKWDIAVWAVTSATAVLILIVALMALAQFRLRENQAVSLFIEKGSTLIASFEAGLRHSGPGVPDTFTFQKLLMETAQQPDIDHIIVTDSRGNVLADSNPAMLETKYGLDLDPLSLAAGREIRWRATPNPGGAGTFEVYRTLIPGRDRPAGGEGPWIIFVGFNMDKIERAVRDDKRGMVMVSLSLALVGSLAIISLFLAQSYRLTRASLSRVTVFSDALVKNMPIGVLALDSKEKIATCNEQVRDLLPCSCDDAIGRRIDELVARPFVDLLDGLAESETLIEKDIILQSGQEGENDTRVWEAVAARLRGEDAPEGKILLVRDVTAIRKMEREVAQSRHLNAIGSLAAGVAHEIRNPLSSIKGLAVYFRERLSGNAEDEKTADVMIAEI